jgi:hypothetical protein
MVGADFSSFSNIKLLILLMYHAAAAAAAPAGVINSNIWGMPMVGADICGFSNFTTSDPFITLLLLLLPLLLLLQV